MTSNVILKYITQDLSYGEQKSFNKYINGNNSSTDWIEKASNRRDLLLNLELKCKQIVNGAICNRWVSIQETGKCECFLNHNCNEVVINAIGKLSGKL